MGECCLSQGLPSLWRHAGPQQDPSRTLCGLGLSVSRPTMTAGKERTQGAMPLKRELFYGCRGEVNQRSHAAQELPSGGALVRAHLGLWN